MRNDAENERGEAMPIRFTRPSEALAAVVWAVCTADQIGSAEERSFIYQQVRSHAVFEDFTLLEFQHLLGATFIRLFQPLPNGELAITEDGVENLIQAVDEVLAPQMRLEAFEMAVGLASADNLCDGERSLLERLQQGLEIDNPAAQRILDRYWLPGSTGLGAS